MLTNSNQMLSQFFGGKTKIVCKFSKSANRAQAQKIGLCQLDHVIKDCQSFSKAAAAAAQERRFQVFADRLPVAQITWPNFHIHTARSVLVSCTTAGLSYTFDFMISSISRHTDAAEERLDQNAI